MSTITKERVANLHQFNSEGSDCQANAEQWEVHELARIALASLETEPVAWTWEIYGGGNMYAKIKPASLDANPLYTAPPAPVAVPECFKRLLHHAYGMTMGHDWNKGTMAGHHRTKLCQAVEECRAAMLQGAEPDFREISNSSTKHFRENAETSTKCWCHACRPVTFSDSRLVVCPECGNKRCPHANDHRNACTASNEAGQEGSAYPAAPQQEVTQALTKGMERYGDAMNELAKREVKP